MIINNPYNEMPTQIWEISAASDDFRWPNMFVEVSTWAALPTVCNTLQDWLELFQGDLIIGGFATNSFLNLYCHCHFSQCDRWKSRENFRGGMPPSLRIPPTSCMVTNPENGILDVFIVFILGMGRMIFKVGLALFLAKFYFYFISIIFLEDCFALFFFAGFRSF